MIQSPAEDFAPSGRDVPFLKSPLSIGAARGRATLILGAPRSGTTWLHNILIQTGRFRGVPGNDLLGNNSCSPFLTDENAYLHRLLMLSDSSSVRRPLALAALGSLALMICARFGRGGEYLLKSPYYCYFLPKLLRAGVGHNFVFLKRSTDAIARSMMRHPHLSKLLSGPYSGFFELVTENGNLETLHVAPALTELCRDNYDLLTPYDRALFKAHCFSSAFCAARSTLPDDRCFIFDYDAFGASAEQRRALAEFLKLSPDQSQILNSAFRDPEKSAAPPEHNAAFRSAVLHAEATLWLAQQRLGRPQRPRLSPGWFSSAECTGRQTP